MLNLVTVFVQFRRFQMKVPDLRLKTKIAATAIIPIFLFLILATVGLLCLYELMTMVNRVEDSYRNVLAVIKVQNTSRDLRATLESYLLSRKESVLDEIKQREKDYSSAFDALEAETSNPMKKTLLSEAKNSM